jgi:proline iminopeptidase
MGETKLFSRCYGDESNKKDRAIVFVHGGPGANSWAFQMSSAERLQRRNNYVVVYDQHGCGRSRSKDRDDDPKGHSVCNAIQDLRDVIEGHGLECPILVGHSWGGFLSLRFLNEYPDLVKGVVIVCSPIDYPEAFYNILTRVHKIYDGMRSLLRMEAFPRMREIEKLKHKMFPLKHGTTTRRPHLNRPKERAYNFNFKRHDVTEVFEHARMLDFSTPINLLLNPGYRELTDKLASLPDSEWFLDFEEEIGGHFFKNEQCDDDEVQCMLEQNNIFLIKEHGSKVHAIYSDGDRMFSKRQVRAIQEELSRLSPRQFSYIYGAGHYPFLEQNRQFLDVLTKHLERIRRSN